MADSTSTDTTTETESSTASLSGSSSSMTDGSSTRSQFSLPAPPTGRRFRWLHLADATMLFVTMVIIALVRYGLDWPTFPRSHYWSGFAVATLIHMIVLYFGGLYDREDRLGSRSWLPRTAGLSLVAVGIDFAAATFIDRYLMPRLNLIVFFFVGSIMLAVNRHVGRRLLNSRYGRPRVLLVGSPDDIDVAERQLALSSSEAVITGRITDEVRLLESVAETSSTDVLLLTRGAVDSIYPDPLEALEHHRINVYHRLTPGDTLVGVRRSRQIAGMPFVALRTHSLSPSHRRLKRILDSLYVIALLPILLPLTLLAWIVSSVSTGQIRPIREERVGRDNETFVISTFATTPTMRRWRLDALPIWWNILRGEMSLVGPRHESPDFVARFSSVIPGYTRRHEIAPGAIGLAKLAGGFRSDPGVELDHDLHYLVNWSPILDLEVLVQSIGRLVSGTDAASDRTEAIERAASEAAKKARHVPAPRATATVSVALAAMNEESYLQAAVGSILAQDYAHVTELVIAVAPSTDRTAEVASQIAADEPRVRVVDNHKGPTPDGFNLAAASCTGDYVAFMNAHCEVPNDYLSMGVATAESTGAANVGGRQYAVGSDVWEQAIAAALNSPIGAGDARHHYDEVPGEIESVPLGIFRRDVFEELGGFDESLSKNEDYELNYRIRQAGHSIWFDPRIVITYRPRPTLRALAKQYFHYGRYKQLVSRMWPSSVRWHHFAPPIAVLALLISIVLAPLVSWWTLVVPAAYLAVVVLAVRFGAKYPDGRRGGWRAMIAAITMHMAWGTGILIGARRGRR